jgi:hypothetical protein
LLEVQIFKLYLRESTIMAFGLTVPQQPGALRESTLILRDE